MKPKKMSKALSDTLRSTGWKQYDGNNPRYLHNWIKGNKVMSIMPSSMGNMYHVDTHTENGEVLFLHTQKLMNLIRGEND